MIFFRNFLLVLWLVVALMLIALTIVDWTGKKIDARTALRKVLLCVFWPFVLISPRHRKQLFDSGEGEDKNV